MWDTIKKRLLKRGTETEEQIEARLHRAAEESRWMDGYDYLIINDDLDSAVSQLHYLIDSQHRRTKMEYGIRQKNTGRSDRTLS